MPDDAVAPRKLGCCARETLVAAAAATAGVVVIGAVVALKIALVVLGC